MLKHFNYNRLERIFDLLAKEILTLGILFFATCNLFSQEIEAPVISRESGFYTDEFEVEIFHNDGAAILYTLDGSEPTVENLDGIVWAYKKTYPTHPGDEFGELFYDTIRTYAYIEPILIKNRENDEGLISSISTSVFDNESWLNKLQFDSRDIFKGSVLRAVAYSNGNYSEVVTRNYFITPAASARYTLPVVCISGSPQNIYAYENGLLVPGKTFDNWRQQFPNGQVYSRVPANYNAKGEDSEFAVNFNFIKDGNSVVSQDVGLRGNGNSSRIYPNKSLRLYARKNYGKKNIDYPFFSDYPIAKFKRLILRNHGQDNEQVLLRDAFLQDAFEDLNAERQRQLPVIVFINAEYAGVYYLVERYDKKYFERKFSISEDQLDFLSSHFIEVGDKENFVQVENFVENHNLDSEENYISFSQMIDVENFTDYIIAQVYSGNKDWPNSNTDFWRKRTPFNPDAPYGHDGRWRWLLKDFDLTYGRRWIDADWYGNEYKYNDLERVVNHELSSAHRTFPFFIKLLENKEYKKYFINRFCDLLNTSFRPEIMSAKLQQSASVIEPEVGEFVSRWNPSFTNPYLEAVHVRYPPYSIYYWDVNLAKMDDFALQRPVFVLEHLQDFFGLAKTENLILNIPDFEKGFVEINSISIQENTKGVFNNNPSIWQGHYFSDVPIRVEAVANPGYKFSHWEGSIFSIDSVLTLNITTETSLTPVFVGGIREVTEDEVYIGMSPNPFHDEIYLFIGEYKGDYTITTIEGKVVEHKPLTSSKINLSHLPGGLYLFSFDFKGMRLVHKIVKY